MCNIKLDRCGNVVEWDFCTPLCAFCNAPILGEIVVDDENDLQFCSDDCLFEDRDERRIARIDARQQYEMYGDDYDSWYR